MTDRLVRLHTAPANRIRKPTTPSTHVANNPELRPFTAPSKQGNNAGLFDDFFDEFDVEFYQSGNTGSSAKATSRVSSADKLRERHSKLCQLQNERLMDLLSGLDSNQAGVNGDGKSKSALGKKLGKHRLMNRNEQDEGNDVNGDNINSKKEAFDKILLDTMRLIDQAKSVEIKSQNEQEESNDEAMASIQKQQSQTRKALLKHNPMSSSTSSNRAGLVPKDRKSLLKPEKEGRENTHRSIQTIKNDIDSRIKFLKYSGADWANFVERVNQLKEEKQQKLLEQQQKFARSRPQSSQGSKVSRPTTAQSKQEAAERLKQVLLRKERLEAAELERKLKLMKQKEDILQEELRKIHESRESQMMRRWAIFVLIGSRLQMMRNVLEEDHWHRNDYIRRTHAAKVIQRAWRKYNSGVQAAREETAMAILNRSIKSYVVRRKERLIRQDADLLRNFFLDVYNSSRIMHVIQTFRYSVIKAQNFSINWIAVRHSRLILLLKQWNKHEGDWRFLKLRHLREEEEKKSGKKKTFSTASKKKVAKDADQPVLIEIPEHIKKQVLVEAFIKRRKAYRASMTDYLKKVENFKSHKMDRMRYLKAKASLSAGKMINQAELDELSAKEPIRPWFAPLCTIPDLYAQMQKAYDLAVAESKNSVASEKH